MARKLIDISVPLQNDVPADPPGNHPTIQYIDHQQGLPRMLQFFDGLKAEDLPDGQGWAVEQVNLRQRPCGSLAIKRRPRGARPWRRVILVLAQVSSMNTSRLGSSRPWYFFHWARRRAMSARSCSLAYRLFFKTDPFAFEKAPHCAVARRRVALSQFGHHCAQGQIRLLGDPR